MVARSLPVSYALYRSSQGSGNPVSQVVDSYTAFIGPAHSWQSPVTGFPDQESFIMKAKVCLPCAQSFHEECPNLQGDIEEEFECCCDTSKLASSAIAPPVDLEEVPKTLGRPPKDDNDLSISAGRKRAAVLYGNEIGEELPCEWRGLGNCGGGQHPILGCISGIRRDIHHGPVKLRPGRINNERDNISLICAYCHHRWHAANDPDYDEAANELLPKAPRAMTPQEMMIAITEENKYKEKLEKDKINESI